MVRFPPPAPLPSRGAKTRASTDGIQRLAEAAKAASQARALHREKIQQLLKGISPKVKGEVVALLKDGRRIDAVKAYRAASGEDLSTAKSVVDAIEEELPR